MSNVKLMCVVAIVAALAVSANAGILYQTGFESGEGFSAGSIGGQNAWVENVAIADILVGTQIHGDQNLKVKKDVSAGDCWKYFEVEDEAVKRAEVDVELYSQAGNTTQYGDFYLRDGWRSGVRFGFDATGTFYAFDGATRMLGSSSFVKWTTYKFVVSADATAGVEDFDVRVYDATGTTLLDSFIGMGFNTAVRGRFDNIRIKRNSGDSMLVDSLTITEVPEPATMAILLLGLPLLRRRRKA